MGCDIHLSQLMATNCSWNNSCHLSHTCVKPSLAMGAEQQILSTTTNLQLQGLTSLGWVSSAVVLQQRQEC